MSKMILIDEATVKLALEALEEIHPGNMTPIAEEAWKKAITAMREALEQQPAQQEPVALEQERKAFEEWIDSGFINKGHAAFHKFSDRDAYCIDEIQNKWKAWEERAKRTTPQAQPAQQQEPETCANCKHNEWPFGMCDGCPKQSDESQTGNWEPEDKQPDYKALYEKAAQQYNELAALMEQQAQQQEPVAWRHDMGEENGGWEYFEEASCPECQPLYTSPPAQRTWVGLTEDDLVDVVPESNTPMSLGEAFVKYGRAIEAKLKEKNA